MSPSSSYGSTRSYPGIHFALDKGMIPENGPSLPDGVDLIWMTVFGAPPDPDHGGHRLWRARRNGLWDQVACDEYAIKPPSADTVFEMAVNNG